MDGYTFILLLLLIISFDSYINGNRKSKNDKEEQVDAVNHPQHYADHYKREVIELTCLLDFNLGNAVKYILRAPYKGNEAQDKAKSAWYINHAYTREKSIVPLEALSIAGDFENTTVMELLNLFPSEGSAATDRESLNRGLDALIERLTKN